MPKLTVKCWRLTSVFLLLLALLMALGTSARAIEQKSDDPERTRAFNLFHESKFTEAVPPLEKLAATYPDDPGVLEKYGFALYAATKTVKDSQQRKLMIARAKEALLRSQELGNDSNLLKAGLEGVAAADSESSFSRNEKAEALMQEGERAYVQGELDGALHTRGVRSIRTNRGTALRCDMYFKKKNVCVG